MSFSRSLLFRSSRIGCVQLFISEHTFTLTNVDFTTVSLGVLNYEQHVNSMTDGELQILCPTDLCVQVSNTHSWSNVRRERCRPRQRSRRRTCRNL